MKKILVILLVLFTSSALADNLIFQSTFDDGFANWDHVGHDWSLVSPGIGGSGQAAQVKYYEKGSKGYALEKNLIWYGSAPAYLKEVIVEFDFRIDFDDSHQPYGGCKFLKIFGIPNGDANYSNITFGMNFYDINQFKEISYGAGTVLLARDTQSTVRYDGTISYNFAEPLPNFVLKTSSITEHLQIKDWHKFKGYMKYNDDFMDNGEYRVWFDGVERLHVINVINRHLANSPFIWKAHFGGYNGYSGGKVEPPWFLTIDNVKIYSLVEPTPEPQKPVKKEKPPQAGPKK